MFESSESDGNNDKRFEMTFRELSLNVENDFQGSEHYQDDFVDFKYNAHPLTLSYDGF